ncbi:UNVERIFIED_CONTAM: hypothetical protein FKN15_072634 [Acipenser sinensis]
MSVTQSIDDTTSSITPGQVELEQPQQVEEEGCSTLPPVGDEQQVTDTQRIVVQQVRLEVPPNTNATMPRPVTERDYYADIYALQPQHYHLLKSDLKDIREAINRMATAVEQNSINAAILSLRVAETNQQPVQGIAALTDTIQGAVNLIWENSQQ